MGEAKNRSRSRTEILAGESRCIYCDKPPSTIEHMPPKCMFSKGQRLSGLEFATCLECNNGTRGADVVAAVFARIRRMSSRDDHLLKEALAFQPTVIARAPGVWEEVAASQGRRTLMRSRGGVLQQAVVVKPDGPRLRSHLNAFSAKLGMALYREHTGHALPMTGSVTFRWFLNSGLSQQYADSMLGMLPVFSNLQQGKRTSNGKFSYRYNSDERSTVAALSQFYEGLYVFTAASWVPEIRSLLESWPDGTTIKPGELSDMILLPNLAPSQP